MNALNSSNIVYTTSETAVAKCQSTSSTDSSVIVTDSGEKIVTTIESPPTVIVTGPIISAGTSTLSSATDVDTSQATDGSVLVYNSYNMMWKATRTLNKQEVDSGEF